MGAWIRTGIWNRETVRSRTCYLSSVTPRAQGVGSGCFRPEAVIDKSASPELQLARADTETAAFWTR